MASQKRVRVAINGFGRVGRLALREAMARQDLEVVAVNDLVEPDLMSYLFRFDSAHGRYRGQVALKDGRLVVDGSEIRMLRQKEPQALPWKELRVDSVLECTGVMRKRRDAARHLEAGARKVIISAPADDADYMMVMGVNQQGYLPDRHHVISSASCTTNALAPVAMILHESFGLERGYALTVHAYTSSQALVDYPMRKRRRSRAAALNLVPTSTGAAAAVGRVLPALAGRLDGIAVRAPNADGSLVDLTALLARPAGVEEINRAFQQASEGRLLGILRYEEDDGTVSSDIIGDSHSAILDAPLTMAKDRMAKVFAWYDNEHGYACRMLDAAVFAAQGPS